MFLSRRSLGLFLLIALSLVSSVSAQKLADNNSVVLNKAMFPFVEKGEVAGLVAAVGNADGIKAITVEGMQNVDLKHPMDNDSLFRIASMTKPITAIGIMILQDEGKLSVERDVPRRIARLCLQKLLKSFELRHPGGRDEEVDRGAGHVSSREKGEGDGCSREPGRLL